MLEELDLRINQFNIGSFSTVYIGGGSPSLLSLSQIKKIFRVIKPLTSTDAEITIEANPEHISKDFLDTIYECGVNRLSLGIQSLSDKALTFVSRRASKNTVLKALEIIKNHWINKNNVRLSLDLISGLPYCSDDDFIEGVKTVIDSGADHISLYSLTVEEDTPLFKNLGNYDDDKNTEQWLTGKTILESSGFIQYEVSNFCKENCQSRHNMTYWRKKDYIGIGSGATGTVSDFRYTNGKLDSRQKYTFSESVEHLDKETLEFEYIMMGLRTLQGINENDFYERFGKSLDERIGNVFSKWQKKGLAEKRTSWWTLGKDGIMFLNQFLLEI